MSAVEWLQRQRLCDAAAHLRMMGDVMHIHVGPLRGNYTEDSVTERGL